MDYLRVCAYHVGFGDALLVEVPDRVDGETALRRILIDVGNVLAGEGGRDAYFEPVLRSIQERIGNQPIDLYVMTHEHLDHVQGLFYGKESLAPPVELDVRQAWLTASAEGGPYYERFPEARRKRLALIEEYKGIQRLLQAMQAARQAVPMAVDVMMANNNPRSTKQCVDYFRSFAQLPPRYVYKGCDLADASPFQEPETRLDIWAPLEDSSEYYGRFPRLTAGVTGPDAPGEPELVEQEPPAGVDAASFHNLIDIQRHGYFDSLLAIDKAANNTSVVFLLEWRGWKLLFPGDAEVRSWKTMEREGVLEPVHFLKVAHHGSENGTPREALLDKLLPVDTGDGRDRMALVSTFPDTYHDVPDQATTARLQARGLRVASVNDEVDPGGHVEVRFPDEGGDIEVEAVQPRSVLAPA